MKIGLMGYGIVGRSVASILDERKDTELKYILELPEKCVQERMVSDLDIILNDEEISVVVDALPAIHPSYEFIKKAILAGKNVVTSNKAALSYGFEEILTLAAENHVCIKYEASCGGTIPDITEAVRLSETNEITACYGIMNGTTNFILDSMEKNGSDFDETLREAQKLGYAEADPTADIGGFDVKNKIAILSATAYRGFVTTDFPVCGIEKITKDIIESFKKQNRMVKLLGLSLRKGERYALGVVPVVLPLTSLEANVPKNFNIFTLKCSNAGDVKLYGQGAGGYPTADAVVRDVLFMGSDIYSRPYFLNQLTYDESILTGTGYINGNTKRGTLSELLKEAGDTFFAFEPDFLN